jgi:DNA-directed RNA polymerase specialized sigma24 family protein
MGVSPNEDDVAEILYSAFIELEKNGPESVVKSLVGFARIITYRRGQDRGRQLNRERERQVVEEISWEELDLQVSPGEEEDEADRETLRQLALECMDTLTEGQRDVVEATIMGAQTLSDWGLEHGVSHQAAGGMRDRAVQALKRCIDYKQNQKEG